MGLSLHEIERGIGLDLLRRPIITAFLNACLLRIFTDLFLYTGDDDEDDDDDDDDDDDIDDQEGARMRSFAKDAWQRKCVDSGLSEKGAALAVVLLAQLIRVLGLAETLAWTFIALLFSTLKLPRVYAFEKLLLDLAVILYRPSVRYVNKRIRFECGGQHGVPRLHASRHGFGVFAVTIITSVESLSRDSSALLHLLRYMNYTTVTYWREDALVMVGGNRHVERALCGACRERTVIDLGWHKDVFECTNFRVEAVFAPEGGAAATAEAVSVPVEAEGKAETEGKAAAEVGTAADASSVRLVGKRAVAVELSAPFGGESVELAVKSMGQFAAVCEAYERGLRLFNGKRVSIYAVGLVVSGALIVFYEGLGGLLRPSADVLTLAVGAFTLWMTVGKSAALGDTQEETTLDVAARDNLLLAYHGLARIERGVRNIGWVPEVFREPRNADAAVDGSIGVLEAAICLSVFPHRGHFVKWSGPRLRLQRLVLGAAESDGVATVLAVERVRNLKRLPPSGAAAVVRRLG